MEYAFQLNCFVPPRKTFRLSIKNPSIVHNLSQHTSLWRKTLLRRMYKPMSIGPTYRLLPSWQLYRQPFVLRHYLMPQLDLQYQGMADNQQNQISV
jgi:uncharacterized protein YqhQ